MRRLPDCSGIPKIPEYRQAPDPPAPLLYRLRPITVRTGQEQAAAAGAEFEWSSGMFPEWNEINAKGAEGFLPVKGSFLQEG
jgi:hypothetical protein